MDYQAGLAVRRDRPVSLTRDADALAVASGGQAKASNEDIDLIVAW